ncbi:leucine--tRNA ligase [Patescibacteria group bacterium]|nr:leucine--tRNA ligase [Patescibacteria group bacterium]
MKNIPYQPQNFEKKWQEYWDMEKTYKSEISNQKSDNKQYVLAMFPYPSGAGLHVGHVRVYTGTDVTARFYRMSGRSVLHPMGFDAFGLPAENAAIKAKKNPMDMVPEHIETFKKQMKSLGLSYDWDREFSTTDPSYYKWTQWLFIQFYKMGLLYKKDTPINYCPVCKTGLAEEEVLPNGTHERCGNKITKKDLPQWIFKITKYADRLLADLKDLDWPEGILAMQRNWIGKKEGVIIHHKVDGMNIQLDTFSAYPAWLFADTFIVIAPEHPSVQKLVKGTQYEKEALNFIEEHKQMTQQEILSGNFEKKGVFTGKYALDPFNNNRKMPIWLANFALMDFGTGIIRCSAHDIRDYEFAQKYKIELDEVVDRVDKKIPVNAHDNSGTLKNSGPFSGRKIDQKLIKDVLDWVEETKIGKREVSYHLRDWIFSRQRYWGEPIPMIYCQKCQWQPVAEKDLPVKLPYVKSYEPTESGESPLSTIKEWVNTDCPKCGQPAKRETDTMPNWAGSCWYFLAFPFWNKESQSRVFHSSGSPGQAGFPSRSKQTFSTPSLASWAQQFKKSSNWLPVDRYLGGAEHAVLHLLYARFWVKALYDLKLLNFKEPFLKLSNVGMILAEDHRKMSKSWGNVINPDDVIKEYGADALRIYEMFMAPFSTEIPWSTEALQGAYRFVKRVWEIYQKIYGQSGSRTSEVGERSGKTSEVKLMAKLNKTIKKVTSDIPQVKFNTSIAAMMEFLNEWESASAKASANKGKMPLSKENAKKFLQILAPFAPFLSEEIWKTVFEEKQSIHLSSWPKVEGETAEEQIIIPVQVMGRLRDTITIQSSKRSDQKFIEELALKSEKVKKYLTTKPKKTIYVPGKIINFIT